VRSLACGRGSALGQGRQNFHAHSHAPNARIDAACIRCLAEKATGQDGRRSAAGGHFCACSLAEMRHCWPTLPTCGRPKASAHSSNFQESCLCACTAARASFRSGTGELAGAQTCTAAKTDLDAYPEIFFTWYTKVQFGVPNRNLLVKIAVLNTRRQAWKNSGI